MQLEHSPGKKEKAARGGFAGGATPLGYKRDLEGGLLVDDAEGDIIRRIASMRAEGLSLQAIASALNDAGYSLGQHPIKRMCTSHGL